MTNGIRELIRFFNKHNINYALKGIIALNMQRYVPYLNNLLGSNIII